MSPSQKSALPMYLLFAAAVSAAVLRGTVRDAYTRQPVPYTDIEVPARELHALTDSLGRFDLVLPDDSAGTTIRVSRIGYAPREWSGSPTAREVTLWFQPTAIRLEGVTVSAAR